MGPTSPDDANGHLEPAAAGRTLTGRWRLGATGLGLALALAVAAWVLERLPAPAPDAWIAAAARAYAEVCRDLTSAAGSTAAALAELERRNAPRLEIFDFLHELAATPGLRGKTLIYFDRDGESVAWAGDGLLHEPDAFELPDAGLDFRRGFTSVTLFAVAPLTADRRPARVLVGRSFPTRDPPFLNAEGWPEGGALWSLDEPGGAPAAALSEDLVRIVPDDEALADAPVLWIDRAHLDDAAASAALSPWPRWAARARLAAVVVLGLTLLALAGLAGAARPAVTALLAMGGLAVGAAAAGLGLPVVLALAASAGLTAWGLLRERAASGRGGEIAGGLGLAGLAVAAWLLQHRFGSPNLAAELLPGPEGARALWSLRLTSCLAALGVIAAGARSRDPAAGDRPAWLATVLLLAAAAFHDLPLVALPLLAAGGAATVRWLRRLDLATRPLAFGAVLLLAALAGAVAWETADRQTTRQGLEAHYLPRLKPPETGEVNDLHLEIHRHFDGFELRRVAPPPGGAAADREPDPQDLAFALWRDSPLPARDGASALIVELDDGTRSSFSFGLPLGRDQEVSRDPDKWPVPPVSSWREAAIVGEARLLLAGRPWGVAEYWFLPRPGFRLEVNEIAELEAALVRGESRLRGVDGLPRPALFGLYAGDRRAISSPWDESPPLPAEVLETPRGTVRTPDGTAWYWSSAYGDTVEVLYLPRLSPRAGLERVGAHALGGLVAVALLLAWIFATALPLGELRALVDRAVYSYSKRLLVVYASLLLVPLVALNLVLLESFEERLRREQQAEGRAALASARLMLFDYIRGLGPGFDIRTRITRDVLEWISGLVRHQVNVYWGSRIYVSSQQELFTAGFLPERIPGDVFARLALLDQKVGERTQHTGEATYLELYAPLETGGGSLGLFVSVPLLEQEEEVARELATLRRRAILVTTALVVLLLAVGGRLAASFTKPIMELIEGTRKIAAGAPLLGVAPRERELSALAAAIDEMAHRIAEGRQKLVLEKEVARRMVENITSGVVSLDHGRRVVMRNRVAAELLGAEVGEEIDRALAGHQRLRPVSDFLRRTAAGAGAEIESAMVELAGDDGETREWTLTWVPMPGTGDPAALLVVDDDTEVLRGQRLEAWAEMARIIAHEIKNPLTPIRLSAEHLRRVYESDRERLDEVFERCTTNILRQVEELRDIASDFSIYSRIPRAELVDGDLVAAMREIVDAYRDGARGGVELAFESELPELRALFDAKLLGRAVRNLLENALRASVSANGARVLLTVERHDGQARISVLDSGPGVDPDNLTRIFEPYFSTHETGTGLGLAISQRIVEEHGGRVEAKNRPGGGLAVTITIPLAEAL